MGVNIYPQYPPYITHNKSKVICVPDLIKWDASVINPETWRSNGTISDSDINYQISEVFFNLHDSTGIDEKDVLCEELFDTSINKYVWVESKDSKEIIVKNSSTNKKEDAHYLLLRYASEKHPNRPEFFAYNYNVNDSEKRKYTLNFKADFSAGSTIFIEPGFIECSDSIDIPITYYPIEKIYPETPIKIDIFFYATYYTKDDEGKNIEENNIDLVENKLEAKNIRSYITNLLYGISTRLRNQEGLVLSEEWQEREGKRGFLVKLYSPIRLSLIGKMYLHIPINQDSYAFSTTLYDPNKVIWQYEGENITLGQNPTLSQSIFGEIKDTTSSLVITAKLIFEKEFVPTYTIEIRLKNETSGGYIDNFDILISVEGKPTGVKFEKIGKKIQFKPTNTSVTSFTIPTRAYKISISLNQPESDLYELTYSELYFYNEAGGLTVTINPNNETDIEFKCLAKITTTTTSTTTTTPTTTTTTITDSTTTTTTITTTPTITDSTTTTPTTIDPVSPTEPTSTTSVP